MRDTPADQIEVIIDEALERRAHVRAVLDGHPVAAATPPPIPPQLELLR